MINTMKRTLFLILVALMTLSAAAKTNRSLTEKDMGAYLFTFFSDPTHSLFMAIKGTRRRNYSSKDKCS